MSDISNPGGGGSSTVTLASGSSVEVLDGGGVNKLTVSAAGAAKVDGSAVTQPVSGTVVVGSGTIQLSAGAAVIGALTANQSVNVAQIGGANTAASAALADAVANPTVGSFGAYNALFNGTTWDRVRSSAGITNSAAPPAGVAATFLWGTNPGNGNAQGPISVGAGSVFQRASAMGQAMSVLAAPLVIDSTDTSFGYPLRAVTGSKDNSQTPGGSAVLAVGTESTKATYRLAGFVTPAATPTDVITITGSGTKTVRIVSITIAPVATAAGTVDVLLIRRSSANSGGTSSTPTIGKSDINDGNATAVGTVYTANAATLGTTVSNVGARKANFTTSGSLTPAQWFFSDKNDKAVVLRGTTDILAINGNGDTLLTGEAWAYDIVWTEE